MSWIFLGITSALLYGSYHFFIKLASGHIHQVLAAVILQFSALVVGVCVFTYLKWGGQTIAISGIGVRLAIIAGMGHDTGGAVALILAIEHRERVNRLLICNSVCYDRFDDDMLDLGHPLRWKPRPVAELVDALEESLAAGLSDRNRLTLEFREGIIAPWASEEGKLTLLRNASALNANQTMALVDRHGEISAPTMILWGMDDPWQKSEDGMQLAREIPGAIFKEINGASHWVQQDAPEEFTTALLEFLASSPNNEMQPSQ